MQYAVIMAGGSGTRLWPSSRNDRPKQFLSILGERTLLQVTFKRVEPIIPAAQIYVVTQERFKNLVLEQLPRLSPDNVLIEPEPRGTAAAVDLAATYLQRSDPEAVMVVLTADHLIRDTATFRDVVASATRLAEDDWLTTIGIEPTHPATGYGYIERGEPIDGVGNHRGFRVRRFIEKPDVNTAKQFLHSGRYDWNSGMFVWRAATVAQELALHMPSLHHGVITYVQAVTDGSDKETREAIWHNLPDESIDYGVLEKSERVAVVPGDIGWNDVGDWAAVYSLLAHDSSGNAAIGSHLLPDTSGSLVVSDRLVVTLGLDDLVIIDTPDVVFVCPRSRAQDVKLVSKLLREKGLEQYLSLPVSADENDSQSATHENMYGPVANLEPSGSNG